VVFLGQFSDLVEGFLQHEIPAVQKAIRLLDDTQLGSGETPASQSLTVDTTWRSWRPGYRDVRWNILRDSAVKADERVAANATKLVDFRERADADIIINYNMASERRAIGCNGMVPDQAVMRYVHIGHDPVVISDYGLSAALYRTSIDRRIFTNGIVITYDQPCALTLVFLVLRVSTD